MKAKLVLFFLLACPMLISADSQWVLDQGTLTYHVSHPLHQVDGISHAVRGKGVCHDGQCDFLIAVPVKSFDSGDSNRDLHMVQVTRGAQYPMVTVCTHVQEADLQQSTIQVDLEIDFAGQSARYKGLGLQVSTQGKEKKVTGTIPAKISDFKIDPPTLLTVPIKNDIPVKVEMVWKQP
jgi:YceI-like protein